MSVKRADLLIGAGGVEIGVPSGLSVFLRAETAPRRTVEVSTQDPYAPSTYIAPFTTIVDPVSWKGSQFEWRSLDGLLGKRITDNLSILAGLKWQVMSFRMEDPRDATGATMNWTSESSGFVFASRFWADFRAKLCIPCAGVAYNSLHYRGSFLWSPLAYANIAAPMRNEYSQVQFFTVDRVWSYRSSSPGTYLEASVEVDQDIFDGVALRVWGEVIC